MSLTIEERYRIGGMDCAACAAKIDTAMRRIDGVVDVSVSVAAGTMRLSRRVDADVAGRVARDIAALGYRALLVSPGPSGKLEIGPAVDEHGHAHHDHAHHEHDHHGHDHAHHAHDHHHESPHDHSHPGQGRGAAALAPPPAMPVHRHDDEVDDGEDLAWWRTSKARLTIASGLAFAAAWLLALAWPALGAWPFVAAMLVGLVPIARRAFVSARYGSPFSIEMLMTIAALGATIIGAGEEAAMVVFLFLIGEMLEGAAARRARSSIRALTDLVPETALREAASGATASVAAESLAVDDIILVRPGDRVAADGVVLSGASAIDEATVTGESVPRKKSIGDPVFAGTINGEGALRVRVSAAAADNTIARIVRLVEEAQEAKAPTERFIDRFSRVYTPAVLAVGALVALVPPLLFGGDWMVWIYKGLALLLIGCPCALVISTPAAIAAALAAGARQGLLMKGGAVLERLAGVNRIAFDKTGTLTLGQAVVDEIILLGDIDEASVLARAAALEAGSSHPLAKAILARAKAAGVVVSPAAADIAVVAGRGVVGEIAGRRFFLGSAGSGADRIALTAEAARQAETLAASGASVSFLVEDGVPLAIFAVRDGVRPDAGAGLDALKRLGISAVMLTGDNARAAAHVGEALGIAVRAELLPDDKRRLVIEMRSEGYRVAKVGDGINDAPALAAADVGIAMGGGTDVAIETADAAVLNSRIGDVARMVRLARRAMRKIRENITIALGLKAVFLVTTLLGITGLWPAILADTGATVLVTLNALTLLKAGRSI